MIGKILKSTAGKPCSCPEGKICTACKKKKPVKPQVYIEEPRRLTIPIVISHYRAKPLTTATVQVSEKSRWSFRKKEPVKKPVVRTTICQWYKRKKELNHLKSDHQKERKRERQVNRRDQEIEFLEQMRQDKYASIAKKESLSKKEKLVVKEKPVKPKKVKARTATAKPQADSKFVSVKQYNRYDLLSNRFVNCCYKLCCQFYCYLSCIFIIGFVIIYFL